MQKIQEVRQQYEVSAHDLANKLKVTRSAIGHYENNRRIPNVNMARKIVSALNELGANCTFEEVFPPKEFTTSEPDQ